MFCCVRGHGRWRPWRTTVPQSRWTPFLFQPVHAWLVRCWLLCVWSVYGHVAAAAAVWLVRSCRGRLIIGWVRVRSVALLPVVLSSNHVCVAGTSVSVLISCVLVCPSVVQCSLVTLFGPVRSGRVTVFRCVGGHGGRRVWLTTVSPACWTPFPYWLMHVGPVWCWPACVRSVYSHVVSAAVAFLVRGRVSRLLVGLFGVRSLALQRALAQSDLLRAGALLVAVLVGASCVGPARYLFTVRLLPTVGEKSNDKWFFFKFSAPFPAPPWQHCMHNSSCGTWQCSVAVLPISPVPFICPSPVGGKAPSVPLGASLCS